MAYRANQALHFIESPPGLGKDSCTLDAHNGFSVNWEDTMANKFPFDSILLLLQPLY